MNRSITSAWANQGRRKVNVNAPLPPELAAVPPKGSAAAAAAAGQDLAAEPPALVPASPGPKRKARSSRSDDGRRKKRSRDEDVAKGSSRSINNEQTPPDVRFKDLGGMGEAIAKCLELVIFPLIQSDLYSYLGIKSPRGVLLHGPPGCGKTRLAQAIAGEVNVPFLSVAAPALVSGTSGESEKALRDLFAEAIRVRPAIIFLDEIDAITPKRETAQREMERRIVAQLLTCMDELEGQQVMVIGATNRPDSLDPALRRGGRFDREIALGVPDEQGREAILRVLSERLKLGGDVDFRRLAKATPGYVGADLTALTSAAGVNAIKRIFKTLGTDVPESLLELPAPVQQTEQGELREQGELGKEEKEQDDVDMLDEPSDPLDDLPQPEERQADDGSVVPTPVEGQIPATPIVEGQAPVPAPEAPAVPLEEQPTLEGPTSVSVEAALMPAPAPAPAPASEPAPEEVEPEPARTTTLLADLPPELAQSPIAAFLRRWPGPLPDSELSKLSIIEADFLEALKEVQPSSTREGFATVPGVTWDDVGALQETREELDMAIVKPIQHRELFTKVLGDTSSGVLLWGPPGCGKTLLAKAVASASRANFISVKGPELLNKYVGESERAVRQVFARARASAPCVIFFDELDALVPRRDDALSESSARVVNTLLTELDGLESRGQTYVVAATNRPDIVDPAMCRPGRLDRLLYIDLPSAPDREDILRALTRTRPLSTDVDLYTIARNPKAEGLSGADCAALVRQAAVTALQEALIWIGDRTPAPASTKEVMDDPSDDGAPHPIPAALEPDVQITMAHFVTALGKITPSVTPQQRKRYEALRTRLAGGTLKEPKSINTGVSES